MYELTLYTFESIDGREIGESTRDLAAAHAFAMLMQCRIVANYFECVDAGVLIDYTQQESVHAKSAS